MKEKISFIFADMPIVTLKMGSSLNPDDIKEGADVYFECLILSNPKPYKMSWFHNVSFVRFSTERAFDGCFGTEREYFIIIFLFFEFFLKFNFTFLCTQNFYSFAVDAFPNTKREFNKL